MRDNYTVELVCPSCGLDLDEETSDLIRTAEDLGITLDRGRRCDSCAPVVEG